MKDRVEQVRTADDDRALETEEKIVHLWDSIEVASAVVDSAVHV